MHLESNSTLSKVQTLKTLGSDPGFQINDFLVDVKSPDFKSLGSDPGF
jgi:hypothetical protein